MYESIDQLYLQSSPFFVELIYLSHLTLAVSKELGLNISKPTQQIIEAQNECPICFEPLTDSAATTQMSGCTRGIQEFLKNPNENKNPHIFHSHCYLQWAQHNPSCPICRSTDSVQPLNIRPPYLDIFLLPHT